MPLDPAEIERRASFIIEASEGIHPPYEAFYIHSVMYAADRCIESFERYDASRAQGRPAPDQVSAVHEALGHAGAVSRFFWPSGAGPKRPKALRELASARAAKLRAAFQLTDASALKDRNLRDALEHFDERIDEYLLGSEAGQYTPVPRVGDSGALPNATDHVFKLVDPDRACFLILDHKFDFGGIRAEVALILQDAHYMDRHGARLRPVPRN
jgi:hypothetical protein